MAFVDDVGKYTFTQTYLDRSAGGVGVPVVSTWYTVLERTGHGYILAISTHREDDDGVAKEVQLRVTIDGVACTPSDRSCNDDQDYHWHTYGIPDTNVLFVNVSTSYVVYGYQTLPLYYGKSLKIEVKSETTALGANPELRCQVLHGVGN